MKARRNQLRLIMFDYVSFCSRGLAAMLLLALAAPAQDSAAKRLAGARFKVADLEKSRKFYTGMLGLEEAFDIKDSSGAVQSAFFKVNDEQFLEFSPGA